MEVIRSFKIGTECCQVVFKFELDKSRKGQQQQQKEIKKKRRDLQTGNSVGQMLRVKKKATCKQTSLKIEGKEMELGQCGCGTVGRVVASVTIGPVFKSSVKCFGKMKIKKRGRVWPIFGHRPKAIGITI